MNNSNKVTVILTSYNHADFLREAIDSVLSQTYTRFDFIIWDDGSTDESWQIITSYSDPRIRAFKNDTTVRGAPIRNAISAFETGEYIAIQHSDDVWEPKKLEKQVNFLNTHPEIGAVFSNALVIGENGKPFDETSHLYNKIFDQPNRSRHEWLNFFFYNGNALCHPSVLIRKECYDACGLYRYGLAQLGDFDMWVRLCLKYEIHIMPEKLVRFRVRSNEANTSGNRPDARIRMQFEFFQIYDNYREIINPEEFLKVFPTTKKYFKPEGFDIDVALGMVALENGTFITAKLFGLRLLFEALNDPKKARKNQELYGFDNINFIDLTAKHDIFSIELVTSLIKRDALLAEKNTELAEKNTELAEIYKSKAWKFVLFLRRIRIKLIHPNNRIEKMLLWVLSSRDLITLASRIKHLFVRRDYQKWVLNNEPGKKELAQQRTKIKDFEYKPLISIVLPVWNTPKKLLNATISSVLQQTYGNLEICIADGNSNLETHKILSDWMKKDGRIRVKFLKENKGIAVNSNEALSLAQGEFIAFLDHDDLLAPFALIEVANLLQGDTSADLIYSDEDKISMRGKRFNPYFKPDFSPEYLRSVNYMSHFLIVRKSLGDQIGWFREGYDGAQDYDLILRLVEKARGIAHIPKILYHWRVWTGSTAGGAEVKPYANTSGKKALQEYLDRNELLAQVEDGYASTLYHVRYHISTTPLISIIIPNQDHAAVLECCINSIMQKTNYQNFEIFLVENGSKEQETFTLYKQLLNKDSRIHLIEWNTTEAFNYSRINNWAARQTNGDVLLFLNNDTQVINNDWLEQMLQYAIRPDIGAVGAKLYYPDDSIQHAGVIVGLGGIAGHGHKNYSKADPGYFGQLVLPHNVSAVTAACLMVRKHIFMEINGFDETYALAFGDVDLCLNILQKGYLNVWTPYAELYHHESKTRGYEDTPEKQKRFKNEIDCFKNKWPRKLEDGDPYYNPNLTLDAEDFSINPKPVHISTRDRVKIILPN